MPLNDSKALQADILMRTTRLGMGPGGRKEQRHENVISGIGTRSSR